MSDTWNPSAHHGLYAEVKALLDRNEPVAVMELAEAALVEGREVPVAIYALSAACYRRGLIGNAIQLISDYAATGEVHPDTNEILAILYCRAGLLAKALYYGKEASITPKDGHLICFYGPDFPEFSAALAGIIQKPLMRNGVVALDRGDVKTAIVHLEQHLLIDPSDVEAIDLYAKALMLAGQPNKALGMLRSLVTMAGLKPTLVSRIGACLVSMGQLAQGLANHRTALASAPGSIALWGNVVADLGFLPADRSDVVALTAGWAACVNANAVKSPRAAAALPTGDHFTIAFLCSSPLSALEREMLLILINNLDKSKFSTLGLGCGELEVQHNLPFRNLFDRWRNVSDLDVLTLGALIRGEGVAVLLDMDGLRQPARAGLFLRNCAPVQAAWLGGPVHGAVPGATMHMVSAPQGLPGELVLPGGRYLLDVARFNAGPVPSAQHGMSLAFGADVSMAEMNPDTVALWSRVLMAVPDSMLLLRDRGQFNEQESIATIIDLFGNYGVAQRIDVIRADVPAFCAQVDVILAPSPHFDVLEYGRMVAAGMPVIVKHGGVMAMDLAAALAGTSVCDRMVAADEASYIELARSWAQTPAELVAFRGGARAALAGSVAFNSQAYAKSFGDTLCERLTELQEKAASA
ncbi:tetratricopeptide repeat protein [Magnetospirillum sulfuroxidans]|uniref:Tetratricopeptide repeat protein n=1 Tax=Magnetospirillum sulfuroxidans TaxID=611300 RepID=A0ABS5IAA2_9PROT|nr:tetratricopeptide repeat protein [Magnetospirillum sulfuroxidans]MBR9971349.1 tetratricopeptide repeat protein [Magnetospirillum sulfuroxidans]